MGKYVAETAIKHMIKNSCRVRGAKVAVLGLTFKENVPDLRNTRVIDIIHELTDYHAEVLVHDPIADAEEARHEYGLELVPLEALINLDALILAVPHQAFLSLSSETLSSRFTDPSKALLLDVKGALDMAAMQDAGIQYWRL